MKTNLLLVEDNAMEMDVLKTVLEDSGFNCLTALNGKMALEIMKSNEIDLVLSDQKMSHMDGLELLKKTRNLHGSIPFIMLTSHGSVDSAIASIREGADDYIQKPYKFEELLATIKRSLNYYRLSVENTDLKKELYELYSFENIVTKSISMQKALDKAKMVAASPKTIIAIHGESGSGKEVLARAIHSFGKRAKNRFVAVNCAGIPSSLLESELFGYVKGAFTGADSDRKGKFDIAQGGTILLDEIGDMPVDLQAKLLRTLEQRSYERVGSNESIEVDFTFIAATHYNLENLVKQKTFREDLFHRINVFPIILPPLRERVEDIPLLVKHFIDHFRNELGKPLPGISGKALGILLKYVWSGNIRELKNCIERAAILVDNELIQPEHLGIENKRLAEHPAPDDKEEEKKIASNGADMIDFNFSISKKEISLASITEKTKAIVLEHCGNNKTIAAKLLKRDRSIFYRKK